MCKKFQHVHCLIEVDYKFFKFKYIGAHYISIV